MENKSESTPTYYGHMTIISLDTALGVVYIMGKCS